VIQGVIFGALLAGGAGRRMGGGKPMAMLAGAPLIEYAGRVMRGSTTSLAIVGDEAAAKHLRVVALRDKAEEGAGPLYGVSAALHWAADGGADWVALAPCDTPFLPQDAVVRLYEGAWRSTAPVAFATTPGGAHPLVSLWRTELAGALSVRLSGGHPSAQVVVAGFGGIGVGFSEAELFNVNTREDMAHAEARLANPG
jgi:molybdopterin-guanine dinucleotide biosynthesis protein A